MFPCNQIAASPITRRQMLQRSACGFGSVALASMLAEDGYAGSQGSGGVLSSTHHPAKAKHVIYLYMDGGPSQVDTWDPKPLLTKENGKPFGLKMEPTQFNNNGSTYGSPFKFENYGESGIPCSDLFPNIAKHVDDMAVIRSMTSEFPEHTNANYFLHTGIGIQGRPSMGAWAGYGLGSECNDLPSFIVLNGGLIPPGGLDCFNSGFLPATFQGSVFNPNGAAVAHIDRTEPSDQLQRNKLDLLNLLDRREADRMKNVDALESAIANYEMAYRMQVVVPQLTDFSDESADTLTKYGLEAKTKGTSTFGRNCLLARRLVEKGVRFIELTCPGVGHDRWDQHSNLERGHRNNAECVDQPIGALLEDLKQRGLLEETLVIWSGEFGRTPFAQGSGGRDHNPFGFSLWMAGGGIKGGVIHGATDEFGYKAIEDRQEIYDLHATMLHLMGIDHERLTFRFSGRDMRLTDVHGKVIESVVA